MARLPWPWDVDKGFSMRRLQQAVTSLGLALSVLTTSMAGMAWAYSPQALYDDVWKLINTRYLDQTKNGQEWRIWRHRYDAEMETDQDAYVAIETMLASLGDRFTRFLDPDEFAEEGRSIKASLFGIGIQIGIRDEKLLVIAPIEDTPADRAGLEPNDEILEIDGKSTQGMSIKEAADNIRGEKGSIVKLLIKRKGEVNKVYDIMRDEIKLKSVSTKHPFELELPESVGYIKLSSFLSSKAAKELLDALEENQEKQAYIVDLRSNPGGLLSNAIAIANFFLEDGGIVSTVDRDGYKEVRRAEQAVVTKKPIVLLIDEGSASASEILSGALKDNHRGVLVGKRTFGKGLVQEINQLPGGAGINITTQKYLTPNDTDIHKKGIEPDFVVKITKENVEAKEDPQLAKALEVLTEELDLKEPLVYKKPVEDSDKKASAETDEKGSEAKQEAKEAVEAPEEEASMDDGTVPTAEEKETKAE